MSVRLACHSMRHQATHQQPSAGAHQTFQVSKENMVWPLDGLLGAELPAGLSLEAESRATCCGFEVACGGEDGAARPGGGADGPEALACRLCLALQHHGRLQEAEAGRNHLVGGCKRVAMVSEDAVGKPTRTVPALCVELGQQCVVAGLCVDLPSSGHDPASHGVFWP